MYLSDLSRFRENNRLEAKKAQGGVPNSLWETYSAFANTNGGVILLGVEELPDHTLRSVPLPNPENLVKKLWDHLHNRQKVSVNLLQDHHIRIEAVDGNRIVIMEVPRAHRFYRPVYVGGNPVTGTFRRSGEGDYHCTPEEYRAMVRDASHEPEDLRVLEEMDPAVLCPETVQRYRARMASLRPAHIWLSLDDREFLIRMNALGIGADGNAHPTAAGLVMFGFSNMIQREYPRFLLDYREHLEPDSRYTDRIVSFTGDWSGNVLEFFLRVSERLTRDLPASFRADGIWRIDDTPIHMAVREALVNCVVNADYGGGSIVILKYRDRLELSNPGGFRIELEAAKVGGLSDPRNPTMMNMLALINIGERIGSGIPTIYETWRRKGWPAPVIQEQISPDRVTVTLPMTPTVLSDSDFGVEVGKLLIQQGKLEEAERTFREALSLDSNNISAYKELGRLLKGQGRLEEAEQWFLNAMRLMENVPLPAKPGQRPPSDQV